MKKGAVIVLLGLAGCVASPDAFPVETYENDRIYLNVRGVRVHPVFAAPDAGSHIESQLPVTPQKALAAWAKNRFHGASDSSPVSAVITISDASLTQETKAADNWLQPDMTKYDLSYRVEIKFLRGAQPEFKRSVWGTETREIWKRASREKQRRAWADMMNAMLEKTDAQIVADIPKAYLTDE